MYHLSKFSMPKTCYGEETMGKSELVGQYIGYRAVLTNSHRCVDYRHSFATCREFDRRAGGQVGHKVNICNEKENCGLCRNRSATFGRVAHTTGSERCGGFRATGTS